VLVGSAASLLEAGEVASAGSTDELTDDHVRELLAI
jgi:hypothetical protein